MNIFTLGKGFISEHLNYPVITDRISPDYHQICRLLDKYEPDVLINCIGKTGSPNIDWCESNKDTTTLINTALPIALAQFKSIRLIQISSGCIFFGPSPRVERCGYRQEIAYDWGWKETDFANPQSYYTKSKYACDLALGDLENVTTLRIRMPISKRNHPRNFINKIRGYKQIIDVPNSVTFMDDLVNCVDWFVTKHQVPGIFHVTNPGTISAADVMREYQKYVPQHEFEIITEEQLSKLTVAKRSNCIIDNSKLTSAGFSLKPAKEALVEYMKEYVKNI